MKKTGLVLSIIIAFIVTAHHPINACWTCGLTTEAKAFDQAHIFRWIDRGILAGMSCPSSREDIEELMARNVGLIVTLTAAEVIEDQFYSGALSEELTSGLYIAKLHLPIQANHAPTLDQVDTFLDAVTTTHARGKATVVHCEYGISRTSVIIACWLIAMHKKYSLAKILKKISKGISSEKRILSTEQEQFVRDYYEYIHTPGFVMPLTSLHASKPEFTDVTSDEPSTWLNRTIIEEGKRGAFELDTLPLP